MSRRSIIRICISFIVPMVGGERVVDEPKWITNDEKGDVDFVSSCYDVVAGRFDHLPVGDNDRTAIESFLL